MTSRLGFARASLALAWALAAACGSDTASPNDSQADLRLINASSGLGALDLSIGDQMLITNVPFGIASPIARVPAGAQRLTVRSGGTIVGTLDAQLSTDHVNAVLVAGGKPQFTDVVDADTGSVNVARANLRLITLATANTTAPTRLQVLLSWNDGPPSDSIARFNIDATVARYSSLLYFDAGHFHVSYVPQGGTTVLAEATFDITAGETKAAVLSRNDDGSYHVEIVTEK